MEKNSLSSTENVKAAFSLISASEQFTVPTRYPLGTVALTGPNLNSPALLKIGWGTLSFMSVNSTTIQLVDDRRFMGFGEPSVNWKLTLCDMVSSLSRTAFTSSVPVGVTVNRLVLLELMVMEICPSGPASPSDIFRSVTGVPTKDCSVNVTFICVKIGVNSLTGKTVT